MATSVALGVGFGAGTSVLNDVSSPYGLLGSQIAHTGVAWAAGVASLIFAVGWAWAALAVAAGWLAGSSVRGGLTGVLALLAATTAYYLMDPVLREEPMAQHFPGMLYWWGASAIVGPVLGVVGANIRRPGVVGLVAGLTVPVGASVQMVVLPPGGTSIGIAGTPVGLVGMYVAMAIVWTAAAVAAGVVVARFYTTKLGRRRKAESSLP